MIELVHHLERQIVIRARREIVFEFFTESARWAAWWGAGSEIDARAGGRMLIRHPNGVEVSGEVLEVSAPERIVFTYGVSPRGTTPSNSRVTIHLQQHVDGTLLHLRHEFDNVAARDEHVQGWRYQLSVFTNIVADAASTGMSEMVDRWCAAWSNPEAETRERELDAIASPDVRFYDRYSTIHGLDDLRAHLAAVHRFMPGIRLQRHGDIRHCQWHVLAEWHATATDGSPRGAGTNAFVFDAAGRISEVTGFWSG